MHEIFKKIITLLTVTVLFLFTFFNLILDAPSAEKEKCSRLSLYRINTYKVVSHLLMKSYGLTCACRKFTVSMSSISSGTVTDDASEGSSTMNRKNYLNLNNKKIISLVKYGVQLKQDLFHSFHEIRSNNK